MTNNYFMDKLRSFFGLRQEPPTNSFRNPIWGSDDEDDGDELYSRQNVDVYTSPMELHEEFTRQMNDMLRTFGGLFGDLSVFHNDQLDAFTSMHELPSEEHSETNNSIRDYYLKPGYHNRVKEPKEDIDLDGKISSNEISGLLKKNEDNAKPSPEPFNGDLVPGRSFCQTIITTSVKKPDGTIETRKIVKNGNEVVEETTTTRGPTEPRGPFNSNLDQMGPMGDTGLIYNHVMSELSSIFRNFY